MPKKLACGAVIAAGTLAGGAALAHFQVLLPSVACVSADGPKTVDLQILFTHPMEQGPAMEMARPRRFGVMVGGEKHDLTSSLRTRKVQGKTAYTASYTVGRPGDHVFYLEPAPYWEPAEGKMIVHYTKTIVDSMGAGGGWDRLVGFPVEIEPLVRPYGLWTGNVFRGIVRKAGRPVPFAEVEVEYWNAGGKVKPPGDAFVTQVVKADDAGVFSYALPRAGWWGFAALTGGDEKMKGPEGDEVDVELGALIWVHAVDMK
jgi:cobalt/nickel transport protein